MSLSRAIPVGEPRGSDRFPGASRRFSPVAALLSLCAHAAVLLWFVQMTALPLGSESGPDPLSVEIINPAPPAPEPRPDPVPPAPVREPPKPAAKPVPAPRSLPPVRASVSQMVAPMAATAEVAGTDDAQAAVLPSAAPEVRQASAPPAGDDRMRLYGEAIWSRIIAHKPRGIRLRGTVGLTFSLSHDGQLIAAEISQSSGAEILDQAALEALRAAAPFPPPPDTATAQQLTFSIPFAFR